MENVQNNLEKYILATIAYFDIFNYPLTEVEIWKWLWFGNWKLSAGGGSALGGENGSWKMNNGISDVQKILKNSETLKSLISTDRGFYFLKNREDLVELREARYVLAMKKIKRARRVAGFLKFIPGIKMIALCNSLAWTNAREESDIDFFVVTARNKIWTARFWAAGFLKFFGLRPSKKNTKDKICLSFFVDSDSLNLESLAIGQPDIYLIYWVAQLQPLFDRGGVYRKFWQANAWIKKFLPNVFPRDGHEKEMGENSADTASSGFSEKFFRWLQLKLMPKNLKEMANRDSRVVVSDHMLKFHANDRREEYKKMWEEKVAELL